MVNAARPPVLKTADFPRVSPDNLVIAVAEKRRIEVDEVYAVRFHAFEDFEIVAEDKFIYGHILIYRGFAFGGGGGEGAAGFFTTITGGLRPFLWTLPFLPSCNLLNDCGSLRLILIASYSFFIFDKFYHFYIVSGY
jgi:hypothetical protein